MDDLAFDPFASVEIPAALGEAVSDPVSPDTVTEEDAHSELKAEIDDAIDFMAEVYSEVWEDAQRYFDGESAVAVVKGQSRAVATVVRDSLRATKPSVMRVLTQSTAIVEYRPTARLSSEIARQQTLFANSVFYRNGGFCIINDAWEDAALKRIAPIKWWYSNTPKTCFINLTDVPAEYLNQLQTMPNVMVHDIVERSLPTTDETGNPVELPIYDVELSYKKMNGEIHVASIPLPEFFYSRNATTVLDSRVVGHQRNMPIYEVMQLGIPYEDLMDLDSSDPELSTAASGESQKRRKVAKKEPDPSADPMMKQILITEVYCKFDLLGTGDAQLWKWLLGGTDRVILKRERTDEVQICIARVEPVPHTPSGRSFFDILGEDQDVQTSALRGTLNNLHQANNRRLAYHDSLVNGKDVNNTAVGHPIRFRAPGMIQEIGVTPVIGAALPLLEHLRMRSEMKIGVTGAAAGLDPDALQSTDKEAVQNTIRLSMGQIELITRCFAESLIPLFRGLLKLTLRHFPEQQEALVHGTTIPVQTALFDPDLFMEAAVGLGTNNVDERRIMLQAIKQEQQMLIKELGPSNPFCDFSHVANAQEDLLNSYGIYNPDRYFKPIPKELGAQIAQQAAQQQAAEAEEAKKIPPPHMVALQAETMKGQAALEQTKIKSISDQRQKAMDIQAAAIKAISDDDFRRDELAQEKTIKFADISAKMKQARDLKADEAAVTTEQRKKRDTSGNTA